MTNFGPALNEFLKACHERSVAAGWPHDNIERLMLLVHSEISECMEGFRKSLMDTHLPHRLMTEVELADAIIRIGVLAGALGLVDVGGAVDEKLEYNLHRADHKLEARNGVFGKKF